MKNRQTYREGEKKNTDMTDGREANNKPHDIFRAGLINSMQKNTTTGRVVRDKTQEKTAFKITRDKSGKSDHNNPE